MVGRLAPLLGMTVPQLKKAINNLQYSPYAPVPVMPDATPEQILYVQENQDLFPGVQATTMSVRTYSAMGKAAANIVGYVGQISQTQYQRLKVAGLPARRPDRPGRRRGRIREHPARHARRAEAAGRLEGQRAHHPQHAPSPSRATTCG